MCMALFRSVVCSALALTLGLGVSSAEFTPAGGKWTRSERIDAMDDSKTVTFTLSSSDVHELADDRRPQIVINCSPKRTYAGYIVDATSDAILETHLDEDGNRVVRVQIRFDDDPPKTVNLLAAGSKGIIIDRKIAPALLNHSRLLIRVPLFPDSIVTDSFTLSGLDRTQLREACGEEPFAQPRK